MKTTFVLAALAVFAMPAFAASTTVEFASVDGATLVAVFSDDGTVSFNGGEAVAYTMDEAASTICSSVNGADNCATFDTWGDSVGHTTPYTTSLGSSGTATITAKTE